MENKFSENSNSDKAVNEKNKSENESYTENEQSVIEKDFVFEEQEQAIFEENKPKSKKKKWIISIIAVVLLIVGGLGGWYVIPKILIEPEEPKMQFDSKDSMTDFLEGIWVEYQVYNSDNKQWEMGDFESEPESNDYYVIAINYCYKYNKSSIYQAIGNNSDNFKKISADDYFTDEGVSIIFNFKDSTIINLYDTVLFKVLDNGLIEDGTGTKRFKKYSDNTQWPPTELAEFYKNTKKEFCSVPEETVIQAMLDSKYEISIFSSSFHNLLSKLSADYTTTITPYDELKDKFSSDDAEWIESNYGEYLDYAYLVKVNGTFLYNPEIPNYYTPEEEIFSMLLIFNEDGEKADGFTVYVNNDFHEAATLVMCGY